MVEIAALGLAIEGIGLGDISPPGCLSRPLGLFSGNDFWFEDFFPDAALLSYREFPKPADEKFLILVQGVLHNLQELVNYPPGQKLNRSSRSVT